MSTRLCSLMTSQHCCLTPLLQVRWLNWFGWYLLGNCQVIVKSHDLNRPIRSPAAEHSSGSGHLPCDVLPSALWPHPASDEGGGDPSSDSYLDRAAAGAGGEVPLGADLWEQRQRHGMLQPSPTLPGETLCYCAACFKNRFYEWCHCYYYCGFQIWSSSFMPNEAYKSVRYFYHTWCINLLCC